MGNPGFAQREGEMESGPGPPEALEGPLNIMQIVKFQTDLI